MNSYKSFAFSIVSVLLSSSTLLGTETWFGMIVGPNLDSEKRGLTKKSYIFKSDHGNDISMEFVYIDGIQKPRRPFSVRLVNPEEVLEDKTGVVKVKRIINSGNNIKLNVTSRYRIETKGNHNEKEYKYVFFGIYPDVDIDVGEILKLDINSLDGTKFSCHFRKVKIAKHSESYRINEPIDVTKIDRKNKIITVEALPIKASESIEKAARNPSFKAKELEVSEDNLDKFRKEAMKVRKSLEELNEDVSSQD